VGTLFAIGYRAGAALPSEKNSTKDTRRLVRKIDRERQRRLCGHGQRWANARLFLLRGAVAAGSSLPGAVS